MRGPLPNYRPESPPTFLEQAAKIARQRTVPYQLHAGSGQTNHLSPVTNGKVVSAAHSVIDPS
jgi:hypothetical protein